MSGYRIIGSSDLFLFDSYQDNLNVDLNLIMKGIIVGMAGKYSYCWTISWNSNLAILKIPNKFLYRMSI